MGFRWEDVKSLDAVELMFRRCDCCGKKANVSCRIETFQGEERVVCLGCEHAIKYFLGTY